MEDNLLPTLTVRLSDGNMLFIADREGGRSFVISSIEYKTGEDRSDLYEEIGKRVIAYFDMLQESDEEPYQSMTLDDLLAQINGLNSNSSIEELLKIENQLKMLAVDGNDFASEYLDYEWRSVKRKFLLNK